MVFAPIARTSAIHLLPLISLNGKEIEKCVLIREQFMAPPTFPVCDHDVLPQTNHGHYQHHLRTQVASHGSDECTIIGDGSEPFRAIC